jgi:hypothetical protein
LCEEARAVVDRVCAAAKEPWGEVDIDADPVLVARHGDYVPVVVVDGVRQDYWRVDGERLARALTAVRRA